MTLLLDTNVFLWWLDDSPKLGPKTRAAIEAPSSLVFVSAATAWEIAVKRVDGKLEAPGEIVDWIEGNGFAELPIEVSHAVASAELPSHHRDPFDRLLIAQAQLEQMTLVARDDAIERYDVRLLDASK